MDPIIFSGVLLIASGFGTAVVKIPYDTQEYEHSEDEYVKEFRKIQIVCCMAP